jgi:hypothetical protein
MQYYAIQHKKTKRFLAGTDFSRSASKPRQILSNLERPPKLFIGENLQTEIDCRRINLKDYRIVVVEVRRVVV